jgi:hypothetical protein
MRLDLPSDLSGFDEHSPGHDSPEDRKGGMHLAWVMTSYRVRRSLLWPCPIATPIHAITEEGCHRADGDDAARVSATSGVIGEAPVTAIAFSAGVMFARGRVCHLRMSSEASSAGLPRTLF